MKRTIEALFDDTALRPDAPLDLPPKTHVRLTIERQVIPTEPSSFLRTARALLLSGPRDWSANLEDYPHGRKAHRER